MGSKRLIGFVTVLGLLLMLYGAYNIKRITPGEWMQILLLLALVIVTGFYAWAADTQARATVKMAEEMRQQRSDSVRPILAIETKNFGLFIVDNHTIQLKNGRFSNVGVGPALNVRCTLAYPGHTFIPKEWPVIAVGDSKPFEFATSFVRGPSRLSKCEASISLEYRDVLGKNRHSLVRFIADEQTMNITERGQLELK